MMEDYYTEKGIIERANEMWRDKYKREYGFDVNEISETFYKGKQKEAHEKLKLAVRKGTMKPLDVCEVCGNTPEKIFAHHYMGYNQPFKIWWVCPSCNSALRHREYGPISIESARKIVISKRFKRPEHYYKWRNEQKYVCEVCGIEFNGSDMVFIDNIPYGDTQELCKHCMEELLGAPC